MTPRTSKRPIEGFSAEDYRPPHRHTCNFKSTTGLGYEANYSEPNPPCPASDEGDGRDVIHRFYLISVLSLLLLLLLLLIVIVTTAILLPVGRGGRR